MRNHRRVVGQVLALILLCEISSCRLVRLHENIGNSNKVIRFNGQVIDQENNAVPGAKIAARVRHWYVPYLVLPTVNVRMIRYNVETGADGRFEIRQGRCDLRHGQYR